jgi:cysteine-rich repeat protein
VEVASCEGVVCGTHASCAVANGVVACGCDAGYSGDGETCASICGDGLVVADEACDDSNTEAGDGCRADCAGLEVCGDGLLDPAADETCDDGNIEPGDGCDDRCELEPVEGPCGDGVLNIGEECDDGNDMPDDGCEACVVTMSDLWTCDPAAFAAGDGCECGCGQLDPDCDDATAESCDYCGGEGACDPTDVGCQNIDPLANHLCK